MSPLTDKQQAWVTFISTVFVALGAYSVPANEPVVVSAVLFLLGALGFALKEALGAAAPAPSTVTQVIAPKSEETFDVSAAKAAGYDVYINSNYPLGYVLLMQGVYTDVYDHTLGSVAPAGTGTKL